MASRHLKAHEVQWINQIKPFTVRPVLPSCRDCLSNRWSISFTQILRAPCSVAGLSIGTCQRASKAGGRAPVGNPRCLRCGRSIHDVYTPGVFTVERHIRGKWACAKCAILVQAPVPAHVIDKGIPTTGLLAQVLIAKYLDHLPLYRQEGIFGRAGLPLPQSTLAQWVGQMGVALQPLVDALKDEMLAHPVLHADETPVAIRTTKVRRLISSLSRSSMLVLFRCLWCALGKR